MYNLGGEVMILNKEPESKNESVFVSLDFLGKVFNAKIEMFDENKRVKISFNQRINLNLVIIQKIYT